MSDYELTALAEKDLRRIARYTIETWGLKQAKRYESLLADRFQKIAQGRLPPKLLMPISKVHTNSKRIIS